MSARPQIGNNRPKQRSSARLPLIQRDGFGPCSLLTGLVKREDEVEWEEEVKNASDDNENDSEYKPFKDRGCSSHH
jgi:hypothetical protein